MPVRIPNALPAAAVLNDENIFVMTENRASTQDIRPLRIAILNLMPTKETTETQLLRLLGNSPLQVDPVLLRTASYVGSNSPLEHLSAFYRTFDEVRHQKFDGLIITGAPVELYEFEEVKYWQELKTIMDWADDNVFSTLYICWAAQAALHYRYGIEKRVLPQKLSGVYKHRRLSKTNPVTRGFDDVFYAPHSRNTDVSLDDLKRIEELDILAVSDEAGVYVAATCDLRQVFVTGHSEYDPETLDGEYRRDVAKGLEAAPPANYYPGDDSSKAPITNWRAHAHLLYGNWLNYCVYQITPYDITTINKKD